MKKEQFSQACEMRFEGENLMSRNTNKCLAMTRLGAAALAAAMLLMAARPSAAAVNSGPSQEYGLASPAYELAINPMQKSPAFFKFQAHISQAKLPVGDVVFQTVYVNVKKAETLICQEQFNNVQVRDSVLNVEIGKTMNCALDELLAANSDLLFQVCIGSQENCLKPIALSSVPYSIKSSYSVVSQTANTANTAVQCHYAHRVTADRDLFTTQQLGVGYFDFHTPTPELIGNLVDEFDTAMSVPSSYWNGGYIQWMQLAPGSNNVHICAQAANSSSETPIRLDTLVMHADVSHMLGELVVEGKADGSLATKALVVKRGVDVFETADFYGDVNVGVFPHADHVCTVNTRLNVNNTLQVGAADDPDADAHFYGDVTFEDGGAFVSNQPAHFQSDAIIDGNVDIGSPVAGFSAELGDGKVLNIYHKTVFQGPVDFAFTSGSIPTNAIKSHHILDGEVKRNDIGSEAVASDEIANGSILTEDLNLVPVTGVIIPDKTKIFKWTKLGTYEDTRFCSITGTIEGVDNHPAFPNTCLLFYNWYDATPENGYKVSDTGWWVLNSDASCIVTCQYNYNDVAAVYAQYLKQWIDMMASLTNKYVFKPAGQWSPLDPDYQSDTSPDTDYQVNRVTIDKTYTSGLKVVPAHLF